MNKGAMVGVVFCGALGVVVALVSVIVDIVIVAMLLVLLGLMLVSLRKKINLT